MNSDSIRRGLELRRSFDIIVANRFFGHQPSRHFRAALLMIALPVVVIAAQPKATIPPEYCPLLDVHPPGLDAGLAVVAIVFGALLHLLGKDTGKRSLGAIVFCVGVASGAMTLISWLLG
jgi:hypothetical protein